MPKNILIFADGTGQIGGVRPDQRLSNIYKMYRAMRPGPMSPISTQDQVAYYDPGLGAGELDGVTFGKLRAFLEQSMGVGIEDNMIDCYERIMAYYEPGDRVLLFGFSRGAYTVRALANVMNLCGIPSMLPEGGPLPRKGKRLRAIATEAVRKVYSHGTGKPRGHKQYGAEREKLGERFRAKYGSAPADGQPDVQGNVQPHFIGVFDTVAALQNSALTWLVRIGFWCLLALFAMSFFKGWPSWTTYLTGAVGGAAAFWYIKIFTSQLRFFEPDPSRPLKIWKPWHWPKLIKHTHRAYWNKEHYDAWLDSDVGFARHALAIDENRADFPRVIWGTKGEVAKNANKHPQWLDQVWFAGCHSDVGGSYLEEESRLSDIALQWMLVELRICVPEIEMQPTVLRANPDSMGLQHDEVYMFEWGRLRLRWPRKPRLVESQFRLHSTVIKRLSAKYVPHLEETKPYRPDQLAQHPQAKRFYCDTDGS